MTVELKETRTFSDESKVRMTLYITGGEKADLAKEGLRELARETGADASQKNLRAVLEQQVGPELVAKRVSAYIALRAALPLAQEQGLRVLYNPDVVNGVVPDVFGRAAASFDVDIYLHPGFKLSSYEPVHVAVAEASVTEEMMQAQIKREMARFARFEATEEPASENDCVLVNMRTFSNGQFEPSLSGERVTVVLSREQMPSGFVDNVIGMNIGDHREFDFAAADVKNPAAVPTEFNVTIDLIDKRRQVVPELTDEFVRKNLSSKDKTVEEFRARVRAYLAQQLKGEDYQRREQLADAELGRRLQGVIADALIERTRDDMIESVRANATYQKLTLSQYISQQGMDERQFQMDVMMQARESLRQGFALDALYEHLQLPVSEADMEKALAELAPGNIELARESFNRNNAWYIVRQMAERFKAHEWLMATAVFE